MSCMYAECYDAWASTEACGLAYLNCMGCCWTICAPVCHSFKLGDTGKGMEMCVKGLKYCVYSCLTQCIAPVDGCINCVLYQKKNFQSGVSGVSDITENCKFISNKIKDAFKIDNGSEPENTFKSFSPWSSKSYWCLKFKFYQGSIINILKIFPMLFRGIFPYAKELTLCSLVFNTKLLMRGRFKAGLCMQKSTIGGNCYEILGLTR